MIPDTDDGSARYMPFTSIAKYIAKAELGELSIRIPKETINNARKRGFHSTKSHYPVCKSYPNQ